MSECGEASLQLCYTHIAAQRTSDGVFLGACLHIGSKDLPFVDSDTKWLTVEKKKIVNGLTVRITEETPDPRKQYTDDKVIP